MSEWLNGDGYPTEEALIRIRQAAPRDVIAAILDAWNHTYGSANTNLSASEERVAGRGLWKSCEFLRLATGGWSGNEDVIAAYEENWLARGLTWRLSAAGGLHILRVIDSGSEGGAAPARGSRGGS